jgi:sulfate permease, SulP family
LLASLALYAIFGTSRQLVVAATSASAVLVFSAVTALGPKSAASYATLAAGMIVVTGLFFLVAGLFRLGFITQFLSRPVMEGFVFGLAIFVTVSQLPKLFEPAPPASQHRVQEVPRQDRRRGPCRPRHPSRLR